MATPIDLTIGASAPVINIKINTAFREELTPRQQEELGKSMANATISPEGLLILDEMNQQALMDLANLPFDPAAPAEYSLKVYYYKAQLAVYQNLINFFNQRIK